MKVSHFGGQADVRRRSLRAVALSPQALPRVSTRAVSVRSPRAAVAVDTLARRRAGVPAEILIPPYSRESLASLVARYGSPLFLLDCGVVRGEYRALGAALPGVTLYYAVKAQPHPAVLATLRDEGSSFEVTSTGEITLLQSLGVPPEHCLHTHPVKSEQDIRASLDRGVKTFVVGSMEEMNKMGRVMNLPDLAGQRDQVRVILRLAFRNPEAQVDLSEKFGCVPEDALEIMERAKELDTAVSGFSFHAGSQARNPNNHVKAIQTCIGLIREARARGLGDHLEVLDIGGGFPAKYDDQVPDIETFCRPIREALQELPSGIRAIAEPGRYVVAAAGTAVLTVRGTELRWGIPWVHLDDGNYGVFSGQMFDHQLPRLEPLYPREGLQQLCRFGGPTCDSGDLFASQMMVPPQEKDLMIARQMGAYSTAHRTWFNMLKKAVLLPVNVAGPSERLRPVGSAEGQAAVGY